MSEELKEAIEELNGAEVALLSCQSGREAEILNSLARILRLIIRHLRKQSDGEAA
jgi:hypothetical protein